MGGLEKITDAIVSKAELEAEEIIKKATDTANEIIQSAKTEMEEKSKVAEEKIREAVEKIMLMGASGDRQEERQIMLASKSNTISQIIDEAGNKMKSMGKDVLLKLIKMYSEGKKGEILFSAKDKELVDSEVEKLLEEEKLKMSKELCAFESGFVIKYGKIEINCSTDSIFEEKYSELTDIVNSCITE